MAEGMLRIGQVAAAAGVSVDTIRYYERRGLLPKAARTGSNYRLYPEGTIRRVLVVRSGLAIGFSLAELARFLQSRDRGTPPCRQVRATAEEILERIDERVRELRRARRRLRTTLRDWDRRLARTPEGAPARLLERLPRRV